MGSKSHGSFKNVFVFKRIRYIITYPINVFKILMGYVLNESFS